MKALTVCQPFASAIIKGLKKIEFRTWSTRYRGDLLIHAGSSDEWIKELRIIEKLKHFGYDGKKVLCFYSELEPFENLPKGVIIGKVNFIGSIPHPAGGRDKKWIFETPLEFKVPIPWRGMPGLFEVPDFVIKEALNDTI